MITEKSGFWGEVQESIDEWLVLVVRWIIKRRGIEFLYRCDVPGWEKYLREHPQYDPSATIEP